MDEIQEESEDDREEEQCSYQNTWLILYQQAVMIEVLHFSAFIINSLE